MTAFVALLDIFRPFFCEGFSSGMSLSLGIVVVVSEDVGGTAAAVCVSDKPKSYIRWFDKSAQNWVKIKTVAAII